MKHIISSIGLGIPVNVTYRLHKGSWSVIYDGGLCDSETITSPFTGLRLRYNGQFKLTWPHSSLGFIDFSLFEILTNKAFPWFPPMSLAVSFQSPFKIYPTFLYWLVWSPCSPRDSQESSPSPQFKSVNSLGLKELNFFKVQLSHPYMTTGKTIALTRRTFVGKVMSLLFNMLSRLVITW